MMRHWINVCTASRVKMAAVVEVGMETRVDLVLIYTKIYISPNTSPLVYRYHLLYTDCILKLNLTDTLWGTAFGQITGG